MTPREQGDAVKALLANEGWRQGSGGMGYGPRCLGAAIEFTLGHGYIDRGSERFWNLCERLAGYDLYNSLVQWNDAPGRTLEEVHALIDRAVAEMEAGQ